MLITNTLGFVNEVKSCIKGRYVRRQITLINYKYRLYYNKFLYFFSLKSKVIIFSSIYNCMMESKEVMLWVSLAEIESQLLEDIKEESSIVTLSNVQGNTYQGNLCILKLYLLLIKTCSSLFI